MKKEIKNDKKETVIRELADNNVKNQIETDPFGSWTGKCKNPEEAPVQDVDDL